MVRTLGADASIPCSEQPEGSFRQIMYFVGLFPNLQDLKLCYNFRSDSLEEQDDTADTELVPLSVPPLHGCLTLAYLQGEKLVKGMIAIFGGLRFRSVDLFRVDCVRLILGASTETLEILRLYPIDQSSKELLLKDSSSS